METRPSLFLRGVAFAVIVLAGPASARATQNASPAPASRLVAPAKGQISVAFVLTDGAVMIDFAGPWEVFEEVHIGSRGASMEEQMPFRSFTVSDLKRPIRISGGMQVVPDYTFDDAPQPRIVVIPAQSGQSPKMLDWIRRMAKQSDVVMSVCTGAFKLGSAGLLKGKKATTHHGSYAAFQREFPDVLLQKNRRWVRSDQVIFTAGGLSSGIDLALHIVELYFDRTVAEQTARRLEYESKGWMGDGAATVSFTEPVATSNPSDALSGGVLGNWQGSLDPGGGTMRVLLHVWQTSDGKLTGTLDSLDEDATGIPISTITRQRDNVHLEIGSLAGAYDGKIDAGESTITGTWRQRDTSLPLVFRRVQK